MSVSGLVTVNEYLVVDNLMKIAKKARDAGAEKVYISEILVRHGYHFKNGVKRVNNLLHTTCQAEGFVYMDQSDITSDHISTDGVHPNFHGSTILKMNILSCFRTFNPFICDFVEEYDRALF